MWVCEKKTYHDDIFDGSLPENSVDCSISPSFVILVSSLLTCTRSFLFSVICSIFCKMLVMWIFDIMVLQCSSISKAVSYKIPMTSILLCILFDSFLQHRMLCVATWWLHACLMVCRVDLCHQSYDEEEDDSDPEDALLDKIDKTNTQTRRHRRCCTFRLARIGSRQRIVILVKKRIQILDYLNGNLP